ncbi:nuclease-related domain-containing protein [Agromyces seonyuensis]|uniref:NERD domain-containing protein n=1 Tax=Agromyces seonyuensis TaxID=2662446 RepID=A0A6I4NXI8_9MICO|nr:nuclease-related domain-containing protein [Agromyces seonyuensis]MWB99026.1 NERD domain-containing protein [Agromyces seonyuensis]
MGAAGGSAQREYERRRAKDEARLRERWGRFGGVAVALAGERQSTAAWGVGAAGEVAVGRCLDGLVSSQIRVLHDRRIPRSRANIDHLVVTPAGVWVVDTKRYKGRPELRVEGGIIGPRVELLRVGGRDQTKLLEGVQRQVEVVRAVVGATPVFGALCFVEADWPLFGGSFEARGVQVLWPKKLAERLTAAEGVVDVELTLAHLARNFRAA